MTRDRRGDLGKAELAQQRGARLGVTPAALGDVVNERRRARQVRIDRLARRLQPRRKTRRQRGDGAAVAARRSGVEAASNMVSHSATSGMRCPASAAASRR